MLTYLVSLLILTSVWANPLPQAIAPATATRAVVSAVASSASRPNVPYGSVGFGLVYNDTEGGKRIHRKSAGLASLMKAYLRNDLCLQVVNQTLVPGAIVGVDRCLNNTAPYPAQRNLFNLTTLNVTANYTGLIAPANQTTLCLSGQWHIPANDTDYATREDRQITLQKCNASDPHQIWRYGIDARVTNGTIKAYKLSLADQTQCATILRVNTSPPVKLVIGMYQCLRNVQSQLLGVVNGTSTPIGRIPGIPLIT